MGGISGAHLRGQWLLFIAGTTPVFLAEAELIYSGSCSDPQLEPGLHAQSHIPGETMRWVSQETREIALTVGSLKFAPSPPSLWEGAFFCMAQLYCQGQFSSVVHSRDCTLPSFISQAPWGLLLCGTLLALTDVFAIRPT